MKGRGELPGLYRFKPLSQPPFSKYTTSPVALTISPNGKRIYQKYPEIY